MYTISTFTFDSNDIYRLQIQKLIILSVHKHAFAYGHSRPQLGLAHS